MKYYDILGITFRVDTIGVNADGRMNYAVVQGSDDGTENPVISIVPSSSKVEMEEKLAQYAKENNLVPELIYKIQLGDRILQGTPREENDFISIDDERKAHEFDKYLAHKSRIAVLEAELKSKVESIKKDYKEQIEAEEEELDAIEAIVSSGSLKEPCQASWERDIENGVMLLVRHSNLKVLSWRKMTEMEAQVSMDDQEAQQNESTEE